MQSHHARFGGKVTTTEFGTECYFKIPGRSVQAAHFKEPIDHVGQRIILYDELFIVDRFEEMRIEGVLVPVAFMSRLSVT